MTRTVFNTYHPLVAATYLVAALAFTMAAFHPLFLAPSLLVALGYNACLKGPRATARSLAWQLPLGLVIALVNPIFSQSGSTILFMWGESHAYYLESLCYGACMGAMLVAVMVWFSNFSHIMTSDKIMQLTGNVAPTLGLMITMILRLVPQFVRRGGSVGAVQSVCTAASAGAAGEEPATGGFFARKAAQLQGSMRNISVLMGWGMEDSLDTAESMRARGWGAVGKRTTYRRNDFRAADGVVMAVLAVLIAVSAWCAVTACSCFTFYPRMSTANALWWGYYPYVALLLMPVALELKERAAWRN
ncbi:MAG: energy-coupling factor transporter transmembrane component T [Coriobacteriia bacterium]|nr:energy-coupling factor transporter transmembrane component T [Coriobacteriia bacterium]